MATSHTRDDCIGRDHGSVPIGVLDSAIEQLSASRAPARMTIGAILLASLALSCGARPEQTATPPSNPDHEPVSVSDLNPESRFDFLLGKWHKFDADQLQGQTTYRRIMKDLVIEQIDDWPRENQSRAFLSYGRKGLWKHSWVDTWRFHLHYEGGFEDGKMVLYQTSTYYESDVQQEVNARQVFSNITTNSFRWDWEISKDGGKTWQFLNGLDFRRVAE